MNNAAIASDTVLKKTSALVQVGGDLTLIERRLLNLLLCHAMIQGNLYNGQKCRIPIVQAKQFVSPTSKDYGLYRKIHKKPGLDCHRVECLRYG